MTRPELDAAIKAKGREMRAAQNAYFAASRAGRFRGDELTLARRLEREFDALLEQDADLDQAAAGPVQRSLF